MIELNIVYDSKALALECGLSYDTFRRNRAREEKHLKRFYEYEIIRSKTSCGINYIFTEQKSDYIPYKEYSKVKRKKVFQDKIIAAIHHDNRQTGSNIARIIFIEDEIQALDLELSTVTNYVRANLRELVEEGYYVKSDYQWCFLDKISNVYKVMTKKDIETLRSYFHRESIQDQTENIYTQQQEGDISIQEAERKIGKIEMANIGDGLRKFYETYGYRPMKVPVYVRAVSFSSSENE